MKKKFIKMNDNKNYLSLGNLFNIIKKYSKVSASAEQSELFCTLFNINNINNTTVNNYLIGYRPISLEYKKIYLDLKEQYNLDKDIFINIIINLLNILDECLYKDKNIEFINNNNSLNKVCNSLLELCKEDKNISDEFYNKLNKLYEDNNLYECFIEMLFYSVLENVQPIYYNEYKLDINDNDLVDYLKINLYEGISYISSLINLSNKNNKYANAELGSLEFSGIIDGKIDYVKCFNYYLKAAKKNHPKACWMVANLILTGRVNNTFEFAWDYLEKAIKLGSIAALNTMGKCYLNGNTINNIIDEEKALDFFKKASDYGYSYAYNNIGLYYEKNNDKNNSIKYFKLSADLGNSWALNKVGEYYRKNNDLENAYFYYMKSIEAPKSERYYYGYYNLAKYYYSVGNKVLGIEKDEDKAKEYFDIFYLNIKEDVI